MKTVPVQEAVGMVLCHDMTRIVPDEYQGSGVPQGARGHCRRTTSRTCSEIGKEHIYVLDMLEKGKHPRGRGGLARIARAAAGPGLTPDRPCARGV